MTIYKGVTTERTTFLQTTMAQPNPKYEFGQGTGKKIKWVRLCRRNIGCDYLNLVQTTPLSPHLL